uniref:uncharacterized protein isoform X1 n=1 Tax=Myxine glutinosa TaxID=7769 RepID=UPI003590120F
MQALRSWKVTEGTNERLFAHGRQQREQMKAQISLPYYVHGITFGSEIQFMRKLSAECSANLHLEPVQQTSSFDLPVLVFCVNSTRVGTDVAAALSNFELIPENQMVIMVVMNHFPPQTAYMDPHSRAHVPQNNVLDTHDCFFSENAGFHSCNENRRAIEKIASLISNYLQPEWKLNKLALASYVGICGFVWYSYTVIDAWKTMMMRGPPQG